MTLVCVPASPASQRSGRGRRTMASVSAVRSGTDLPIPIKGNEAEMPQQVAA